MSDVYYVVIACPETGRAVRTGLWLRGLAAFEDVEIADASVQCPHCTERHPWNKRDAWLQGATPDASLGSTGAREVHRDHDPRCHTLGPDDVSPGAAGHGPDDV